jgi:hypothetical protein
MIYFEDGEKDHKTVKSKEHLPVVQKGIIRLGREIIDCPNPRLAFFVEQSFVFCKWFLREAIFDWNDEVCLNCHKKCLQKDD